MAKPRALQPPARLLTRALRIVLRTLAKYKIFKVTVVNREVIPTKGRVIIACNHVSLTDPVFMWGAMRRPAVAIAKAELWDTPVVSWLMRSLGHIPVIRGNKESAVQTIESAQAVLVNEGLVFIYPEGTCSRDGALLRFKPGVVDMAFATNSPVIPAGIIGSNAVLPLSSKRISRQQPVTLSFGKPLHPKWYEGPDAKQQFMDDLRLQVLELSTS